MRLLGVYLKDSHVVPIEGRVLSHFRSNIPNHLPQPWQVVELSSARIKLMYSPVQARRYDSTRPISHICFAGP